MVYGPVPGKFERHRLTAIAPVRFPSALFEADESVGHSKSGTGKQAQKSVHRQRQTKTRGDEAEERLFPLPRPLIRLFEREIEDGNFLINHRPVID
jgi:hypothetical protein